MGLMLTRLCFSGKISWLPPSIYVATCEMDMNLFPYDTQHCPLHFVSMNYDSTQLNMTALKPLFNLPDSSYESTEWELQVRDIMISLSFGRQKLNN